MADSPHTPGPVNPAGPAVRLELRLDGGRPRLVEFADAGLLIGSVAGCDVRLPGTDLPPVICLLARHPHGLLLRKLSPTQPVRVNGKLAADTTLQDGDRVGVGALEILVHVKALSTTEKKALATREEFEALTRELDARQARMEEQLHELETDRIIWYARREEIEKEVERLQAGQQALAEAERTLHQREQQFFQKQAEQEQAFGQQQEEWGRRDQELETRAAQIASEQQQVDSLRAELNQLRQQLHDRYRDRRDRLAGLQEAVNHAARKVQETKREVDAGRQELDAAQADFAARVREFNDRESAHWQEMEARGQGLADAARKLEEQQQVLEAERQTRVAEIEERLAACEGLEKQLAADRQELDQKLAQYQADLVRLDRWSAQLEEREVQSRELAAELERRSEELRQALAAAERQTGQLENWQHDLAAEAEHVAREKTELEIRRGETDRRATELEEQQALLAALRTQMERAKETIRREEQQCVERRTRQDEIEEDLRRRMQEVQNLKVDLEAQQRTGAGDRKKYEEKAVVLETAMEQARQIQSRLAAEEEQLKLRAAAVEARVTEQEEEGQVLQARAAQLLEMQDRLSADRQAFREREADLGQKESVREALQEQLRRRSEELAQRQRELDECAQELAAAASVLQADQDGVRQKHTDFEVRAATIAHLEEGWQAKWEMLKEKGRALGRARKTFTQQRSKWKADQEAAALRMEHDHREAERLQQEVAELQAEVPEWETRVREAGEQLARARDQFRGHLGELHVYACQSQADLEELRGQVQAEADQVRQQSLAFHRQREEHRLAVVAFRQQLLEWQSQLADLRRDLTRDEGRLERRQAEVDARSAELAQQAEQLQAQEKEVTEKRSVMERHLSDMREWYRRKLRELTERYSSGDAASDLAADGVGEPGILALTEEEPGDRKLGDLLRSLELVDAETLAALLVQARKQRQTLRQVLLAGGYLTLYQLALIEAGNLDGLVLGPVRVMDRLRATSREVVYRVFDPRRSPDRPNGPEGYAVLRHLAEAEMEDAVHPDEFRQRFTTAAGVRHPNLAATYEVFDVTGRPAALQEWVVGLPAADWPSLAAVPGVWLRLLKQFAQGLHAAHQAGLIHGHLHSALLVLTVDGELKIQGLGDPFWLADTQAPATESGAVDDLIALGQIALEWSSASARRKVQKKPFPDGLQSLLQRLSMNDSHPGYENTEELLRDLESLATEFPMEEAAWEKLLAHVRSHNGEARAWRKSA